MFRAKRFRAVASGLAVGLIASLLVVFLPASVDIDTSGHLSVTLGTYEVLANPGWVTPTGEVLNGWSGSGLAWDDNTTTSSDYTLPADWGPYLELTHSALQCTQVQIWSSRQNTQVDQMEVDVYYSGAYNNIYSGAFVGEGAFYTFAIGSEQSVTAMRVRYHSTKASRLVYCHEADFWEVVSATPTITNTPSTWSVNGGSAVAESSSYWSNGSPPSFPLDDGECYFTVTNDNSGAAVDITVVSTDFTGGVGWNLAGTPGLNEVTMKSGKSGDTVEGDMVTLTNSPQSFITSLANNDTKKWELKLETGTFGDGVVKSSTVTLTASLSP